METIYNAEYFYRKFYAIPDERWLVKSYGVKYSHCAYGHCGYRENDLSSIEGQALADVFGDVPHIICKVVKINDGEHPDYQQSTPRLRILAALADILKAEGKQVPNMEPEVKPERVVYVTVDALVRELQEKELCKN